MNPAVLRGRFIELTSGGLGRVRETRTHSAKRPVRVLGAGSSVSSGGATHRSFYAPNDGETVLCDYGQRDSSPPAKAGSEGFLFQHILHSVEARFFA